MFVMAEATSYPTVWKAAVPPIDRTNIYSMLQGRELSENDYHLLLSLDGDNLPPLHRHLVQALEKVDPGSLDNISEIRCNICTSLLSVDPALRRMRCRNNCIVHESCALSTFIEAESEGNEGSGRGAAGVCCPCCDDDTPIFPSLRRQPRRKREQNTDVSISNEINNGNITNSANTANEVLARGQTCGDSVSAGFIVSGNVFGGLSGASVSSGHPPVPARVGGGSGLRQGNGQGFRLRSASGGLPRSQTPQTDTQDMTLSSQSISIDSAGGGGIRRSDSAPSLISDSAANDIRGTINRRMAGRRRGRNWDRATEVGVRRQIHRSPVTTLTRGLAQVRRSEERSDEL